MIDKFFVYGTLLKGYINYERYLHGKIIKIQPARTKGELYHLIEFGYPAMVEGNDYVYGELIEFEDYTNTVRNIDKMEHYYDEENPNNEYNRMEIEVELLEDGSKELAYAYIYNLKSAEQLKREDIYIKNGNWKKLCENFEILSK
jgi:gamma-glutamylcyclotransferase (GGCT)/AIG2-like uncharacterized protein YtfP